VVVQIGRQKSRVGCGEKSQALVVESVEGDGLYGGFWVLGKARQNNKETTKVMASGVEVTGVSSSPGEVQISL